MVNIKAMYTVDMAKGPSVTMVTFYGLEGGQIVNCESMEYDNIIKRFNALPMGKRACLLQSAIWLHSSTDGLALYSLHKGVFLEVSYSFNEHGEITSVNNIRIPTYKELEDHLSNIHLKDLY